MVLLRSSAKGWGGGGGHLHGYMMEKFERKSGLKRPFIVVVFDEDHLHGVGDVGDLQSLCI